MEIAQSEVYRAVFDLVQAVADQPDLETLCNALAASLRRVIPFDFLGVLLHDPNGNQLRLHAVSAEATYPQEQVIVPVRSDHFSAPVWFEQKPLVLSPLEDAIGEDDALRLALGRGMHALTLVPLSHGSRKLGILAFGFGTPSQPEEGALRLLQRVASQFAVSVDVYLTRYALQRERDRLHVLFEITNSLVSKLSLEELFSAISEQLSRVVRYDLAGIGLLDDATGKLHLTALYSSMPIEFSIEPSLCPEGLPFGEALATGKPVTTCGVDFERYPSPVYRRYMDLGFRSSCSIPLAGRNRSLGVLDLLRRTEEPFADDEVDLLVQVGGQISIAIENSLAYREISELKDKLAIEKLYLEDEIRSDQNIGSMIGESAAFQAVLKSIRIVAPTDSTVLIQGETGTGKELVARAIHDLSARCKRSFIKVNCAAIPATLLESELFGHEKGSFTGAFAQRIGRFELAHQGTLFLDEIGEIPLELQPKLLRAIQEQEVERLGGNRTIHVDVRFVAATNRDLQQMVDEGKFRSDLYYRLNVFPLTVPPLRERREDIPPLIRYFAQKHAKRMKRVIERIPSAAMDALMTYEWPGNIRELQNVVERSVILSSGPVLQIAVPEAAKTVRPSGRIPPSDEAAERARILRALRECGGKVSGRDGAAARLGMRRTTLQSRMKKLKIEREFK